jgi:Na+/H+ antiporter NhaD/arsenite permease-like protein
VRRRTLCRLEEVAKCRRRCRRSRSLLATEFALFALTLLGVAVLHRYALPIALTGLAAVIVYKWLGPGFVEGPGLAGLAAHFGHELVTLVNLLFLLLGFALLARQFEDSRVPALLPRYLPQGAAAGFVLLAIVFVVSSFLDNIAAALIGGAIAHSLYGGKVHIGFLAAIVAASNAGGSGSVIGDTTTTMMWIEGVPAGDVLHAYVAALVALLVFGMPAALQQHRHAPIAARAHAGHPADLARLGVVAFVLVCTVAANVVVSSRYPDLAARFPVVGSAVLLATLVSAAVRRPEWTVLPAAAKSALFLLSLVSAASLMPVEQLPAASPASTLGLGFVSAVFDNIPLTALALRQGGYDWGVLAYAVGFGGSMLWFGSSAGVALSAMYPEARSTGRWIKHGWHVALAYVLGYTALLAVLGWHPLH